MKLRKSSERGHFANDWLNTHYSFSFAEYYDPNHMGFSDLRVINDDLVAPTGGFPTHGHRNMEIISYICEGRIAHRDSMGNIKELRAGDIQVMSAGRGVTHSEFNPDSKMTLRLLQIWIEPAERGITPSYREKAFTETDKLNNLRLIVSQDGRNGSLAINQDADVYAAILTAQSSVEHEPEAGRASWLQVVSGQVMLNQSVALDRGDGVAFTDGEPIQLKALDQCEFLLFSLRKT